MKKKIAVFANGWSSENVYQFICGIKNCFPAVYADVFVFLSYAVYGMDEVSKKAELTIYDLPDLNDFDGAIIMSASMNFTEALQGIVDRIKEAGIPGVVMGAKVPGLSYVGVDNYTGMKQLVDHLIEDHGAKKIKYVAGTPDNEDSNVRLHAVKNSMLEHGLSMAEDDVFYSNWDPRSASDYAGSMFKDPSKRPDAFVCANDTLAMFISFGLEDINVFCPDDVLITGFDFHKESQLFYPSIASVDQHFDTMGYACAKILLEHWYGETGVRDVIIPCKFVAGESCGCANTRKEDDIRRKLARDIPRTRTIDDNKNGRIKAFEMSILSSDNYSNLHEHLQGLFYRSNGREGRTFYMAMNPMFASLAYDTIDSLPKYKYSKKMDMLVAKEDGVPTERSFDKDKLVSGYTGEGPNRTYVFIPLYNETFMSGYLIFGDNLEYIDDFYFQKFQDSTIKALDRYKQQLQLNALNEKLQDLMQKDALTAVKNRTAFESQKAYMEDLLKEEKQDAFAVCMFDVNSLKEINDELGHEAGDAYIKNACKVICESFKHSPVYRVGGDEFVVFITGADYEYRNELMQGFKDRMFKAMESDLPRIERVSIASGMSSFDPKEDTSINDVFARADAVMYENKYEMKNGNVR